MIIVENKNGTVQFEETDIILFIEEQIKLVPGIIFYKKNNVIKFLREVLKLTTGKVEISQITTNEIFITLKIIMNKDVNYSSIEDEIYNILEYSLQKKYGLKINNLEIIIENLL